MDVTLIKDKYKQEHNRTRLVYRIIKASQNGMSFKGVCNVYYDVTGKRACAEDVTNELKKLFKLGYITKETRERYYNNVYVAIK